VVSRRSIHSDKTGASSSKTYISHLERRLTEEKRARERLEQEIEKIRKINSEISSRLGIPITNATAEKESRQQL
jgi:predicted RNase H-like nuclease (RuvC/YqgF family)